MFENSLKSVVVLTGAGASAESGLKTFRDHDGLWEGHRVEEVATPEAFAANPSRVHEFYNLRRAQLKEVEPNKAHQALARFEQQFKGDFTLVTQNVDNLHEKAGSENVIHMHGELSKVRCTVSGDIYDWEDDLSIETANPKKDLPKGTLRPHICWFGEAPFFMDEIMQAVSCADLFVAIGTSGVVYPAAGLVSMTPGHCEKVLINLEASDNTQAFDHHTYGPASVKVSEFFANLA